MDNNIDNLIKNLQVYTYNNNLRFYDYVIVDSESYNNSINLYIHGFCHYFALALSKYFKGDCIIHSIFAEDTHTRYLSHAFVEYKGFYYDARGLITEDDLLEYYINTISSERIVISENDIILHSNDDEWGHLKEGTVEELILFIEKYHFMYSKTNKM